MSDPNKSADNAIQFPRLIAESEAAGAFTPAVMIDLVQSMDLEPEETHELVDRAEHEWQEIKARTLAPDALAMTPEAFLAKFPDAEEKVDLLEDMACPNCGGRDNLKVEATSLFDLSEDGTEQDGDTE